MIVFYRTVPFGSIEINIVSIPFKHTSSPFDSIHPFIFSPPKSISCFRFHPSSSPLQNPCALNSLSFGSISLHSSRFLLCISFHFTFRFIPFSRRRSFHIPFNFPPFYPNFPFHPTFNETISGVIILRHSSSAPLKNRCRRHSGSSEFCSSGPSSGPRLR